MGTTRRGCCRVNDDSDRDLDRDKEDPVNFVGVEGGGESAQRTRALPARRKFVVAIVTVLKTTPCTASRGATSHWIFGSLAAAISVFSQNMAQQSPLADSVLPADDTSRRRRHLLPNSRRLLRRAPLHRSRRCPHSRRLPRVLRVNGLVYSRSFSCSFLADLVLFQKDDSPGRTDERVYLWGFGKARCRLQHFLEAFEHFLRPSLARSKKEEEKERLFNVLSADTSKTSEDHARAIFVFAKYSRKRKVEKYP